MCDLESEQHMNLNLRQSKLQLVAQTEELQKAAADKDAVSFTN